MPTPASQPDAVLLALSVPVAKPDGMLDPVTDAVRDALLLAQAPPPLA